MDTLLSETLAAIEAERKDHRFSTSFDLAKRIAEAWGENNLADRLNTAIPQNYPWDIVASLFDILSWTCIENGINDNGAAISRTIEGWLQENDDTRRIQIALNLEVYPFIDQKEMEMTLDEVANRHPQFRDRCKDLIRQRQQESERARSLS
ncbi:MAG: hypothetical protein FJ303_00550 [Planctomycetes bacterium]|nr:hypothetical protein [Planctomycetota bacterium]